MARIAGRLARGCIPQISGKYAHPKCIGQLMGKKMKMTSLGLAAVVSALALGFAAPVCAQDANEIISLAKAQWAAQDAKKPATEAFATVADDYTEFNAVMPTLVKGKALNVRFFEAATKDESNGLLSEMLNPNVQFYGDVAILTYNFAGYTRDKDGKVAPDLAKSTRVYAKVGGKWMLVHANFAPMVSPK